MMFRWIGIVALATTAPIASQAPAPQSLSFSCDAPAGAVSIIDGNRLPQSTAISGSLRAVRMRQDSNLRPTATVRLASRKDFVVLQISPVAPNSNFFTVLVRNGDNKEEERTSLGEVFLNQTIPFQIKQVGKQVIVAAGDQKLSISQSFRGAPTVGVSCSTGQFRFDNITLG